MTDQFVVFNSKTGEAYGEGSSDHCASVRRQLPKADAANAITRTKSHFDLARRNKARNHLHEAAPEMLAALKAVDPFGDLQPAKAMKAGLTKVEQASFDEIIAKVRAAIAKAEGRP